MVATSPKRWIAPRPPTAGLGRAISPGMVRMAVILMGCSLGLDAGWRPDAATPALDGAIVRPAPGAIIGASADADKQAWTGLAERAQRAGAEGNAPMSESYDLTVNGQTHRVSVAGETPLLYVLRNDLGLNGAKFGCGLGQCGACTVNIAGSAVRSCITPVEAAAGRPITTIESTEPGSLPALQAAFVAEQAMQCGYCINGMIMQAKPFLDDLGKPGGGKATDASVRDVLALNLCRCGAHNRIVRAVLRAAGTHTASGT